MKRNNLIITAQILSGMLLPMGSQSATPYKESPLNIVIFIADDLGRNDIGPYGNKIVQTPNIDQLGNESLLFSNAFASSPTCSPSRSSIYTSMFPFRNGAHANHTVVKEGVKTLPVYLQDLGYRVAIAGKFHVGPMSLFPFELIHNTNVQEPGTEGVLNTDLNMGPVNEWLSEVSKKKQPFVLAVNDHSPHVVWPEIATYDPSNLDIPLKHIDTEDTRKSRARYYTDITKMDGNLGKLLSSLDQYGLSDNTIVIFTCDQGPQWAFGKWNLYDYGIRVPLLIRWPGMIKGGTETDAMVSLVDLLPTCIEIAGGKAPKEPEEIDGRSLLPFLKGNTRNHRDVVFAAHTGDGNINMAPMRMIRDKRYKYILNLAPDTLYNTHINLAKDHDGGREYWDSWENKSFTTEQAASVLWRYHNRPAEELYDIQQDPEETRNLASDEHYKNILIKYREQLSEWREQQGDHEKGVFVPKKAVGPGAPYIFK
jgi:N-sulfoglucosamine sulfohydrolase